MNTDILHRSGIMRAAAAARQSPFRGSLLDNCRLAPMGKGHGNAGRPFDIETACYLKPLVASFHRSTTRKQVVMAGVKTLKSFYVEMAAAYHVCHGPGDVGIFFGTAESAEDVSTTRILSYFDGIPSWREKCETITGQWDYTMGAIKFPDKTFWLKPANLANAQQKNLGFVGVQDAFVAGANGMIDQLIERTTQYAADKKIVLESQGGEVGFDFDRHYLDTNQGELHVLCPACARPHVFNWRAMDEVSMMRGPEFVPVPPRNIPSLDHAAWIEQHRPLLLGRVAGFQRGAAELIKFADGSYDEAAVLRETRFECFHCGSLWRDDGEFGTTRIALDVSSHYVAANPQALVENEGFSIAQWINRRLPWGKIMLEKLKRQKTAAELGNYEPLKQFWQKFAGRTWNPDINAKAPEKIGATVYEINSQREHADEVNISGTDIQFNLTHMIYQAWKVRPAARLRLLHYEWIKPPTAGLADEAAREFCKARVRELDQQFGIEPQNSMKDCAHRPDLMREWAAEDAIMVPLPDFAGRKTMKWISFGLLMGDERTCYKWANPGRATTLARFKQYEWTPVDAIKDGRRVKVPIHHRLWSNPSIKEIAVRWRDGDSAPKIEVHEKFLKDVSKDGFMAQMISERLLPWKGRPGKLRWDNEGRPNHAWDGFCMVIERMDELGMLNHFDPPTAEE